jgi:competence protein ComEC
MGETVAGTTLLRPAGNPLVREQPSAPPPILRTAQTLTSRNWLGTAIADALAERRLFILLPFGLIAGLTGSLVVTQMPDPLALSIGGLVLAAGIALAWRRHALLRLLIMLASVWCGFGLLTVHGALFGTQMLERPAYGQFEAIVVEVLAEGDDGPRLIVSQITPLGETRAVPMRRARIVLRDPVTVAPGDMIRGPIRFAPVPGPVLPGAFDAQFHAYFDGIGAYGNATGTIEVLAGQDAAQPARLIASIRHGIATRIDAVLANPAAGIARALINGDQSQITEEAREVMATAGIAHVYSVSGLHLTMVAGGVFVLLRAALALLDGLAGRLPVKRLAAGFGIAAALGYYAISGGNVAALRSTVMIVLIFLAVIFGRRALTMRNVAIAAILVILTDPASVFRPSFQLSFAAVLALVGTYELVRSNPQNQRGLVRQAMGYFGGITLTSLVAGAATLVFSAYHFQQTSPLGVIGNLVTLPLVGFVMMPMAALSVLLMPMGLEALPLRIMGWSIDRMLDLSGVVAQWSGAIDASPLLSPTALLIALAGLGWFAFIGNRVRLLGPLLVLPAILAFAMDRPPDLVVADTTLAVAMRGDEGLALISGKPGSFAVRVWEETYGQPIAAAADTLLRCDALACIGTSPAGFSVAIAKSPPSFAEDCDTVDLIIARKLTPPAGCKAQVISGADLTSAGVHWLAWNPASRTFEVRTAMTDLNRPWRAVR